VARVEIRVKGHLDAHWSEWFEGLTITNTERDETILSGHVADQSALYGLMTRLRDLGVQLLGVECEENNDCQSGATGAGGRRNIDP
jgi:hypothetical protein